MFGFVIDHLWQSTIFAALAAAVAYLLRHHAARWRYWIWFAASMKFLVPFAAITAFGAQFAWRVTPGDDWYTVIRQVLEPSSALEQKLGGNEPGDVEQSAIVAPDQLPAPEQPLSPMVETPAALSDQLVTGEDASQFSDRIGLLPVVALYVWLLGTCLVLLRWGLRWSKLRTVARQAARIDVPGIPCSMPELRSCPSIMEPGIFGIVRPVLLIPEGIVNRLTTHQLAAIVQHERVHIERRDNLSALLHMFVEAIFWFYPVVWWIGAKLIDERERACDEAVLAGGVDPECYASGLIAICDFYVESPLRCAAGVGGGSLENRVKRIADNEPPLPLGRLARSLMLMVTPAVLLGPLAIGLLSASAVRGQPAAQENERRQIFAPSIATPAVYAFGAMDALPTNDLNSIAISPDGTQLAFVAPDEGRDRLWVQDLATGEMRVLPGTNEVSFPFWSPDGKHLGFFNNDVLSRIELATGTTQTLVRGATWGAGGSWGPDGTILFGRYGAVTIQSISADGRRSSATRLSSPGEGPHIQPHFLPDGRHFLYYVEGSPDVRGVYVSELAPNPNGRRLVDSEAGGVYALGRLYFVQAGTLMAQQFDPTSMTLSGIPEAVAEQIPVARSGAALSATGDHVIYRQGLQGSMQQLAWFDRNGNRLRTVGEPFQSAGAVPSLSPDGSRVVVSRVVEGLSKIFTVELATGTASRLSNDPGSNGFPIWSFDGQHVLFSSNRSGIFMDVYRQSPNLGSEAEKVFATTVPYRHPMDWSRDGRYLMYRLNTPDVWALDVATSREIQITSAPARWPQISPDGRWIAYQMDTADGSSEIYIHGPFDPPETGRRSEAISIGGGGWVRWGANGRELYYVAPDGWLMAVSLSFTGDEFFASEPERLFAVPMTRGPLNRGRPQQYMVGPQASEFLVLESPRVVSPIHRLGP